MTIAQRVSKIFPDRNDAEKCLYFAMEFCGDPEVISLIEDAVEELGTPRVDPQEVLDMMNAVSGQRRTDLTNIRKIVKAFPKLTLDDYRAVLYHKKEWLDDPKMKEYYRPATIFASTPKFRTYLEDARVYWAQKLKA